MIYHLYITMFILETRVTINQEERKGTLAKATKMVIFPVGAICY